LGNLKHNYDYIIAGMGAAGLSLAMQLKASTVNFNKILLIDKDLKNKNDRTWCFWSKKNNEWFNPLIYKTWNQFEFKSKAYSSKLTLKPFTYNIIKGIDFYNYCISELKKDARFEFKTEEIISISSEIDAANLKTLTNTYTAKHIFNSAIRNFRKSKTDNNLIQHFKGWLIETKENSFDDDCPVFMDFNTDQKSECRFFYILPFSKTQALIEYTVFSKSTIHNNEYDQNLSRYISDTLKLNDYQIIETEYGEIPMYESEFINTYGNNVTNIGTAGGFSKPSTGYTFYFIQKNTKKIIKSLEKIQSINSFKQSNKYKLYDKVLLDVLSNNKVHSDQLFTSLFKKNKTNALLAFLNEESSMIEDLKILNSVPKLIFLKSMIKKFFK
jgi:lycopene beta-cyclase